MVVGYGKKIREKVADAKSRSAKKYKCPSCSRTAVRRSATGLWQCGKCGRKYASAAYDFRL